MQKLLQILQLLPAIIDATRSLENFIPLPGNGKAKLDLLLDIMTTTYDGAKNLVPEITAVIGKLVGAANTLGVFKKS